MRRLTRISLAILVALAGLGLAGVAQAATAHFDFEGEPTTGFIGSLTSLSLSDNGLSITITRPGVPNQFDLIGPSAGKPAGWGDVSLAPFVDIGGTAFLINFSLPVSSVSVEMGDYGPSDADFLEIRAFAGLDAGGAFLGNDTENWLGTDSFPDFRLLSVSAAGIQSMVMIGGGEFPNSVFYDNIRATFEDQRVPLPASLLLLGMGLVGLRLVSRRRLA